MFLLDFASQGWLHLKGVRRVILMIEVRALSIASDRNTTEMGLRYEGIHSMQLKRQGVSGHQA